jgi:hydroxymethylglutaryl-CoA reductase
MRKTDTAGRTEDAHPAGGPLPAGFHKLQMEGRREALRECFAIPEGEWEGLAAPPLLIDLADIMVESAVGCVAVPLGVANGFLIDGQEVAIPMAVEEPSVIAAARFAARLTRRDGGFTTWGTPPVMIAQVFLEGVTEEGFRRLAACEPRVRERLDIELASLVRRGGGCRGMECARLEPSGIVKAEIHIDVRDALGANRLNTAAEGLRPLLEGESGGRTLMAILSNDARERRAGARFAIPVERLSAGLPPGMSPAEAARRVAAASVVAQEDPARAVTHNKGIMNGIASLALATMNDTRAVEAAAHAWASRGGRCRGLSTFAVEGGTLRGELELPLALATVGGSVDLHPAALASLRVLGGPDAPRLARIAAALGLAQNFAALLALVTNGIQKGHMRYHAARLAWRAGARGAEARRVADAMADGGVGDIAGARAILRRLREPGA